MQFFLHPIYLCIHPHSPMSNFIPFSVYSSHSYAISIIRIVSALREYFFKWRFHFNFHFSSICAAIGVDGVSYIGMRKLNFSSSSSSSTSWSSIHKSFDFSIAFYCKLSNYHYIQYLRYRLHFFFYHLSAFQLTQRNLWCKKEEEKRTRREMKGEINFKARA